RLNVEYYRTEQFDAIVGLNAQTVVDLESVFPERVQRDESGRITLVDVSLTNLFHRETEGMDFSADYSRDTPRSLCSRSAAHTTILPLSNQYSATQPELDTVNRPAEGGAAKYKSKLVLAWEGRQWNLSWTARYTGAYEQYQRSS